MLQFSELPQITGGQIVNLAVDRPISILITDSRKAVASADAIFFAIKGIHHDGHAYIKQLYSNGVRQFIVENNAINFSSLPGCNVLQVASSVQTLQSIAAHHRLQLQVPVIGITGSNGKTITKEWLYQLLSPEYKIAKNPGSYNSQLGVPLSVWQLQQHHQLGIFEAGISRPGEMENLQRIIQPTIGLFTNIGTAHDEGFTGITEKINEKLKLFSGVESVIYCRDHELIHNQLRQHNIRSISWGSHPEADMRITKHATDFLVDYNSKSFTLSLPFHDAASIENCMHCVAVMLYLGYSDSKVVERMSLLRSVPMRLELKEGINQCQVVDDTYNNDLAGLQISLDFLSNQHQKRKSD